MRVRRTIAGGYVAEGIKVNSNVSVLSFTVEYGDKGIVRSAKAFDKMGRERPVPDRIKRVVLPSMFGHVVYAYRIAQEAEKANA